MSDVHYFPRYSQKENVITNNTLLLLLRLYDYDRFKFSRFLRELLGDELDFTGALGLQFKQQRGTGSSVVDGYISQESITIVVETKRSGEAFGIQQLRRHLSAFKNESHKLLVLLSPTTDQINDELRRSLSDLAAPRGVTVVPTSFDRIIETARATLPEHDEEMCSLVEDFAVFCSAEGLLPRDNHTMLVPPCGKSFDENVEFKLYYCPATRSHRHTAYLGVYKEKEVRRVGRIARVVACDVNIDDGTVEALDRDVTLTSAELQRILGATRAAVRNGWDLQRNHKFFLCDSLEPTAFRKTSSGGIQGHRYFDLTEVLAMPAPEDIEDLAKALCKATWE